MESLQITEEWSNWIKPFYDGFIQSKDFEMLNENKEMTDKILKFSKEEFFEFARNYQLNIRSKNLPTTNTFVKLSLPYLDSKYDSIALLSKTFQSLLTKLKRDINLMNHYFDQIWYYHTKTFEKISDLNYDVVVKNIDGTIPRIARMSKSLIKLTDEIISIC